MHEFVILIHVRNSTTCMILTSIKAIASPNALSVTQNDKLQIPDYALDFTTDRHWQAMNKFLLLLVFEYQLCVADIPLCLNYQ